METRQATRLRLSFGEAYELFIFVFRPTGTSARRSLMRRESNVNPETRSLAFCNSKRAPVKCSRKLFPSS